MEPDFSAIVRWRMKYDRNPVLVVLQDKLFVREYARKRGVETARLHHVTAEPETIPFQTLPSSYFIKANHGCGWNILCLDSRFYRFGSGHKLVDECGRLFSPQLLDRNRMSEQEVVTTCARWMRRRYVAGECAYQRLQPMILVEELLVPAVGEALIDWRFYVFDGQVKAASVGSPVYRLRRENFFVDRNFQEIPLSVYQEAIPSPRPMKPDSWQQLVKAAERIGSGVDFVRVDLYETSQGVRLGEATVYPDGGVKNSPTGCPDFNLYLGGNWRLCPKRYRQIRNMAEA